MNLVLFRYAVKKFMFWKRRLCYKIKKAFQKSVCPEKAKNSTDYCNKTTIHCFISKVRTTFSTAAVIKLLGAYYDDYMEFL